MSRILVGTCSWADPSLVKSGRFYPPGLRGPDLLRSYAERFSLVEIDSLYYGIPRPAVAAVWLQHAGPGFVFDAKAYALLAHHPPPLRSVSRSLREELPSALQEKCNLYYKDHGWRRRFWESYADVLAPLQKGAQLGVVLLQFPPWFLPGREGFGHLFECREHLPGVRLATEFRHPSWVDERNRAETLAVLRELEMSYVCVDEPQGFRNSVPSVVATTAEVAVVRLHGRNRETWGRRGGSVAERFDYRCDEAELAEWVPRVRGLAAEAGEVHVLFNNCNEDKAVVNAAQMQALLGIVGPPHGQATLQL